MRLLEYKYSISGVNSARTLMSIAAASGKPVRIVEASVTNADNATNQQAYFALRKVTSTGTYTTTLTAASIHPGDAAASATVKSDTTAEPTYTSNTEIGYEGAPMLLGWRYLPLPNGGLWVGSGVEYGLYQYTATSAYLAVMRVVVEDYF